MEKEKDDFSVDFLDKNRQKEFERKIETGEITCNLDSPEECEACGS
tara:strand:- start:5647 stop:5784 length:138 start_codon:yes stop_codon:yes gene_type:complete